MGDSRSWGADKDEDFGVMVGKIKNNPSSFQLANQIKGFMVYCDDTPLTKDQRRDLESIIHKMLNVLENISGLESVNYIPSMWEVVEKVGNE